MYKIILINGIEEQNKDFLIKNLAFAGYDVSVLKDDNILDFITYLHSEKVDLIIIDLSGEGNRDNFKKLRKIKQNIEVASIPVLAITDDSAEVINRANLAGINEYIVTPIRKTDLARVGILINKYNQYSFKPGTVVFSKYKIISLLGQGASSTVYKAVEMDSSDGKLVALKIIKSNSNQKSLLKEFQRETTSLSKLSHKGIVSLIDFGCYESIFFIAVDFIEGKNLQALVDEKPLREKEALNIAIGIAEVLVYIKSCKMLHRDIKAENIIITQQGYPLLIDLGLADSENSQPDWSTNEINGTPLYLSPEYIDGQDISIQSDLYALGVTLFYAVSGRFPFKARSPMAILAKHLNEQPPELIDIVSGISKEFSDLISKILVKNPEKRISLEDSLAEFKKLYEKIEKD